MGILFYCEQKDFYTFLKNLSNFSKPNYRTRPNIKSLPKVDQNSKVDRKKS